MKVAILAGGRGERMGPETDQLPKPLVDVNGQPVLWRLLKYFAAQGLRDFYIALGYRGEDVKRYFRDALELSGDVTIDLAKGSISKHADALPDWRVNLIETGLSTSTGGRVLRLASSIGKETFLLTWCDGLANIDLERLISFHKSHGRIGTLTAVRPPGRFGHLELEGDAVRKFDEKPAALDFWINGAFFVLEPEVFDYIDGDDTDWETDTVQRLIAEDQMMAYRHDGFWRCMDTVRDRDALAAQLAQM